MKIYILLALAVLAGIFVFQNTEVVEIRFLVWHLSLSRVVMLLGALAIGFVCGVLAVLELMRRRGAEINGNE